MGIISRRINPLTDQELKVHEDVGETYSVHKYFYPKPLKTGKKSGASSTINVDNLENEIKREFEDRKHQVREDVKRRKESRDEKMKTKMLGSWYSSCSDLKKKGSFQAETASMGESITPKVDPSGSFSRFLRKGVLIVRD